MKLIVVGDPGVGKTSFIHSLLNYPFSDHYNSTTGVEKYVIQNGSSIFTIFDNYQISNCHEGIEGVIVMSDVTKSSLIEYWRYKSQQMCGNIPVVTVINKIDLFPSGSFNCDFTISCKTKYRVHEVLSKFNPNKTDFSMYDPVQTKH